MSIPEGPYELSPYAKNMITESALRDFDATAHVVVLMNPSRGEVDSVVGPFETQLDAAAWYEEHREKETETYLYDDEEPLAAIVTPLRPLRWGALG